jgi:Ca2+-dependent lipid-binding protein
MSTTKCVVRVYIVDAFNLSSRDNGSESDPYLIVKCGNRTYNQRDKYQSDEPNPKFNSSFDFEAIFPGCAPLVITVMDYDEIFGDESIGVTSIDLEDRFFSPEW